MAARTRHAGGPKGDPAQLPALLALPRAGHLPRHRPVVRVHGQEQPARERAQGHRERRRVDSRVGFEPYRIHGGRPSRLVHLAPAFVGRAHPRVQMREVRLHRGERADIRRGDRPVLPRGRRRVVHARAVRVPAARREMRDVRLHRADPREGHPRRVVGERRVAHQRVEASRGRGSALPGRHVPGRLRPAPRLVPVVAAH